MFGGYLRLQRPLTQAPASRESARAARPPIDAGSPHHRDDGIAARKVRRQPHRQSRKIELQPRGVTRKDVNRSSVVRRNNVRGRYPTKFQCGRRHLLQGHFQHRFPGTNSGMDEQWDTASGRNAQMESAWFFLVFVPSVPDATRNGRPLDRHLAVTHFHRARAASRPRAQQSCPPGGDQPVVAGHREAAAYLPRSTSPSRCGLKQIHAGAKRSRSNGLMPA